jgi:hypothetical protein
MRPPPAPPWGHRASPAASARPGGRLPARSPAGARACSPAHGCSPVALSGVGVGRSQGSPRWGRTGRRSCRDALVPPCPPFARRALRPALGAPFAPGAGRPRRGRGRCGAETAAGRHQGGCRGPPMVGGRLAAGATARHQAARRQGRPSPRGDDAAEHLPRHLPPPTGTKFQSTDHEGLFKPFLVGGSGTMQHGSASWSGTGRQRRGAGRQGRGQGGRPGEKSAEGAEA